MQSDDFKNHNDWEGQSVHNIRDVYMESGKPGFSGFQSFANCRHGLGWRAQECFLLLKSLLMCLVIWSRLRCIVKIPTIQEWVSWPEGKLQLGSLWCCRWNPGESSDCPLWHTYYWTMFCNTNCKMSIPILLWQLHRYCDLWCSIPSTRLQIVKALSFFPRLA